MTLRQLIHLHELWSQCLTFKVMYYDCGGWPATVTRREKVLFTKTSMFIPGINSCKGHLIVILRIYFCIIFYLYINLQIDY